MLMDADYFNYNLQLPHIDNDNLNLPNSEHKVTGSQVVPIENYNKTSTCIENLIFLTALTPTFLNLTTIISIPFFIKISKVEENLYLSISDPKTYIML